MRLAISETLLGPESGSIASKNSMSLSESSRWSFREKPDVMLLELPEDAIHARAPVTLSLLSICPIDADWLNLNAAYARAKL